MFTEDLDVFMNTEGFAKTVTFNGVSTIIVDGFSNIESAPDDPVLTESKTITIKTADAGTVVVGQDVVIDTERWQIVSSTDLHGLLELALVRYIS